MVRTLVQPSPFSCSLREPVYLQNSMSALFSCSNDFHMHLFVFNTANDLCTERAARPAVALAELLSVRIDCVDRLQ